VHANNIFVLMRVVVKTKNTNNFKLYHVIMDSVTNQTSKSVKWRFGI